MGTTDTVFSQVIYCHAADFGYLHDSRSGQPIRDRARHAVRRTRGFPQGVAPAATPARLVRHVGALPYAIDPLHEDTGALLISPSYAPSDEGVFHGAWVTIQRVCLNLPADPVNLPGDAVRASCMVIGWNDYAEHGPRLGRAIARLSAAPVTSREPETTRIDHDLVAVALSFQERTSAQVETAACAIAGAVVRGERLRLDARWCASETEFIAAFTQSLGYMPQALRGHVSAAIGITAPDYGFQITWCLDDLGLAPGDATARALIDLGAGQTWRVMALTCVIPRDERFPADHGLVSPNFDVPDFHTYVRRHIRKAYQAFVENHGSDAGADARLARFISGGDVSPAEAECLMADLARPAAAGGRMRSGVAAVLTGIASATTTFDELILALSLCDRADFVHGDIRVARVHRLAGQLLSARLANAVVISDDLMSKLARWPALTKLIADDLTSGKARFLEPLRRGLSVLAREDRNAFRRMAGRLLPRDHRVLSLWNGVEAHEFCLASVLFDACTNPQHVDISSIQVVSQTLLAEGKLDQVREALAVATRHVSDNPSDNDRFTANADTMAASLRLIVAIASALERSISAASDSMTRPRSAA